MVELMCTRGAQHTHTHIPSSPPPPTCHTQACKLSAEERLKRIQRYREKRLNRNFQPNVKYQCRKSLADQRPRIRGRFARDEPGEGLGAVVCGGLDAKWGVAGMGRQRSKEASSGGTSSGSGGQLGVQANTQQGATSPPTATLHSRSGSMHRVPSGINIVGASNMPMSGMLPPPGMNGMMAPPPPPMGLVPTGCQGGVMPVVRVCMRVCVCVCAQSDAWSCAAAACLFVGKEC